jgi:hypothetical protein
MPDVIIVVNGFFHLEWLICIVFEHYQRGDDFRHAAHPHRLRPAWAGGLRPAKGFIAISGFAFDLFTLAGIGLGFISIAGVAFGIGAGIGGIATGCYALGGIAIGVYAVGGLGIGTHTLANDSQLPDSFKKLFPR